jgi:diguanylate cyclase (GGDEF)-like protein
MAGINNGGGEYREYKCRNNLRDIATPIFVSDQHVGNLFLGQFMYDDEVPEYEVFKNQADKYGFDKGDGVIRLLSALLKSAVAESGNRGDFICHIGGEDFVILTTPEKVDEIAESVIHNFDTLIPNQYDADARANGGLAGTDRDGKEVKYPLLTISLGVVNVLPGKYQHYSQIVDKAKEMLKLAKSKPYSTCVIA